MVIRVFFHFYSMAAGISGSILIFTFFYFWIFRKKLAGDPTITLDVDWFYRRPAQWARRIFLEDLETAFDKVESMTINAAGKLALFGNNPMALFARSAGEKNFSPDAHRPAVQMLIILVLFAFILLTAWGFFLS